jgi:glycine betaine transporter
MGFTVSSIIRQFPVLFWIPGALVILLFIVGLVNPDGFFQLISQLNNFIYSYFGSFYLWFAFLTLIVFVVVGLSPLGCIRLGGPDAQPEFSVFSWFAMLFCAGMGTGLMFWGAAEPLYHFMNPPLPNIHDPIQKEIMAFHYSFFHWGLHPWAMYGMTGAAIGYFGFNLKKGFHISSFLSIQDESFRAKRHLGRLIDLFTILAIVFGIATTFGMGVLQLLGGFNTLMQMDPSPLLAAGVILGLMVTYMISALTGIRAGIKRLSNASFIFYFVLLSSILVLGPAPTIIKPLLASLPEFFIRLPQMSLGLGNYANDAWVGEWTVKYWSWWIAWAPFVGIFIAFISKGRTLRQLMFASMILPTIFSYVWFVIFGEAAITLQQTEAFAGSSLDYDNVNVVLFKLLQVLSEAPWLAWLCLFVIALNFVTSADTATYTIASLSARNLDKHPPAALRIGWSILFACLTSLFFFTGGIHILMIVFIWLVYHLLKHSSHSKAPASKPIEMAGSHRR